VLILGDDAVSAEGAPPPARAAGRAFYDEEKKIRQYLSAKFGLPEAG